MVYWNDEAIAVPNPARRGPHRAGRARRAACGGAPTRGPAARRPTCCSAPTSRPWSAWSRPAPIPDAGQQQDAIAILRAHGANTMRLRLFVNPNDSEVQVNDLAYTIGWPRA